MRFTQQKVNAKGIKFTRKKRGKVIARAYLFILRNDLHKARFGLMEDVFVDESVRDEGIGTKLVETVIRVAEKHGCYKLIATSRHSRTRVHDLYRRLGFEVYGAEFRINFKTR